MDVLVLCIDRDDDLGRKAGIKSPVVGREENLNAALALGLADPEESDTNTIFGGLKIYDELSAERSVEIATITGDEKVGLSADRKLAEQLEQLIERLDPKSVIVVSDGAEDEAILPIIQSRIKVDGVRRILVKQNPSIESTYYLLKQVFTDPKISHTIFIPPGLALLMFSIFYLLNYPNGAIIAITGSVGLYLLFRGLGLDDFLDETKKTLRGSLYAGKISFVTYILAGMLIIIATIQGVANVWYSYKGPIWYGYLTLLMLFINASVWWYVAAGICANVGKLIDMHLEGIKDPRTYSYPFFLFATGLIFWGASIVILANFTQDFSMSPLSSIQYFAVCAMGAMATALLGIKLKSYIAKRNGAGREIMKEGVQTKC
ncbi:MAG: DUF373 family protein [Methanothrix sp.]|nr:DUF373 family protein [Methanothrix sp.]MCX8206907.1 DUF373 family protein [Methanothrix sp.]